MPSFKRDPVFWARLVLGGIFIWAGADKILHPAAFAQAIYNYQILPGETINLTALILPWVEVLLGMLLVLGVWLPGAVALANVLLLVFLGALVFNVARGLDVHCGCFSSSTEGDPATLWYLLRDTVFLCLGGYLFVKVFLRRGAIRDSAAP
ncbi:MauE/DoxX family redox-associated membrane protein [Desulforhabdus sp. TSK]|uniref:MauE/DoxX family redox-associated membrane protein n=1 Tax=Desulforhabdus sp. TSK TaxID=2925014 RepID=UPI001FC8C2EA|nr:MauE/DoxX family redox-associated membrane protein [Desulforhabdus sp. TSK]GKT06983.1 hypothetical protein DSTSK_02880 [Desulforhabdus sp. TSK]